MSAKGEDPARNSEQSEPSSKRKFVEQTAAELEIRPAAKDSQPLRRRPEPVLRWAWTRNEHTDGTLYVWPDRGRPEMLGGLYLSTRRRLGIFEFLTISPRSLTVHHKDDVLWKAPQVNLVWHSLPMAPPPAASERRRLTQMRELAGRFTAVVYHTPPDYPPDFKWHLELLTTPLHRYSDPKNDILDGAVFAYTTVTDPQVFVLLESQKTKDGPQWQYACARMCGWELHVSYDKEEVWSVENVNVKGFNKFDYFLQPLRPTAELFDGESK
jgi:hypothetical protein